jgi:hypothetical protein
MRFIVMISLFSVSNAKEVLLYFFELISHQLLVQALGCMPLGLYCIRRGRLFFRGRAYDNYELDFTLVQRKYLGGRAESYRLGK